LRWSIRARRWTALPPFLHFWTGERSSSEVFSEFDTAHRRTSAAEQTTSLRARGLRATALRWLAPSADLARAIVEEQRYLVANVGWWRI
jgi:hypothetical protein